MLFRGIPLTRALHLIPCLHQLIPRRRSLRNRMVGMDLPVWEEATVLSGFEEKRQGG